MAFDFASLQANPLLQMGLGLLRASGPSTTPHSFGQDLASAFDYAGNNLGNAEKSAWAREDRPLDREYSDLRNRLAKAQIGKAEADAEADRQWQALYSNNGGAGPLAGIPDSIMSAAGPLGRGAGSRLLADYVVSRSTQPSPPSGYRATSSGLEPIPGGPADPNAPRPKKPLPSGANTLQDEHINAIGTTLGMNKDLEAIAASLRDNKLRLGFFTNLANEAQNNFLGSNDESRKYATLKATLEKMRNASLLLNKGVQTEGDAQRAWNELIANMYDNKLVENRLNEIKAINERATNLRKVQLDTMRSGYGLEPFDYSSLEGQGSALMKEESSPAGIPIDATPSQVDQVMQALPSQVRNMGQQQKGIPVLMGKKIRVTSPDGTSGMIDASELPMALKNGWRQQ